jgi:two-component system, OmpR family, response regulator
VVTALSDYGGASEHEGVRTLGNLSLNLNSYRVAVGQDVIGLTYHELELLRVFFDQYDRVIPYKEITERIWGTSERTALRHLNVLVHRLRTKIASSYPYVIETVRGRGYGLLKAREAESAEGWPAGAEPAV